MLRHSVILSLIIMLMISCSESDKHPVFWQPDQPKAGQNVTITFSPQRLISGDNKENQIFMIYQCISDNDVKNFRLPMKSRGKSWQATINCEPGTLLLRLKFEDSLDRVEDNDGYGWNIILRDNNNKVPKNSYYRLGRILSQKRPLSLASRVDDARQAFQTELSQYPNNYQCWFDLWNLRLKNALHPQSEIAAIKAQLDSLLQADSSSPDLLYLAFECNWKLLNEPQKAIGFGQKILAMGDTVAHKDAIDYGMILLTSELSPPQLIEGLIRFVQRAKDPEFLRPAYYQLGLFFQNLQMEDQAIYYFSKYVDLAPDEIPIWLNLANLFMRKGSYAQALEHIHRAQQLNSSENYFLSHAWETPEERANQLIMNQCQILSTLANLETNKGNHRAAIKYRRQALGLGTPFPAFEWTQIGNLFLKLGLLDSAQQAYVKSVSIDANQDEAIQNLKQIYRTTHGGISGFDAFLAEAIINEQKASAKVAPDFVAMDISGRQHRLSDQRGKIIILTFWDSWSAACQKEIPQLNELVDKHRDTDRVVFWAFSVESQTAIERFIIQNPFRFVLFPDAIEIKRQYQVIGVPTHLIIDPSGKIRHTHIGYSDSIGKQLDDEIRVLLSEALAIS